MYTPFKFRPDPALIIPFTKANPFGLLVSVQDGTPIATHIPFHWLDTDTDSPWLFAHIARANPQGKGLQGQRVLCVFSGPHAYISPSWYTVQQVPTWNYLAVHVTGTLEVIEGETMRSSLSKMTHAYEDGRPNAQFMENLSDEQRESQVNAIIGFKINIEKIEANFKLSQNRDDQSFINIVTELKTSTDPLANAIADEMQKLRPQLWQG